MNGRDPEERIVLAGEYVLGLLPTQDLVAFERELARDRDLARAVADWQDRLLEVAPVPDPVAPAPDLWQRIERDLPPPPPPSRAARAGFWNSLAVWRSVGIAGLAATVALAWTLFHAGPQPAAFSPGFVAVLQSPGDKRPGWLVEIDAGRAVRLTPLAPGAVAADRSLQLWTKPEGAAAPVSLGLVTADRRTLIVPAGSTRFGPNQFFAISVEPERGSPTGLPTGPVVAVGESVAL